VRVNAPCNGAFIKLLSLLHSRADFYPTSLIKELAMGRGDKRSRKGKIFKGSYGNVRPHRVRSYVAPIAAAVAVKAAPKPLSVKKK
jgi:30S ribosomal protein S31